MIQKIIVVIVLALVVGSIIYSVIVNFRSKKGVNVQDAVGVELKEIDQ